MTEPARNARKNRTGHSCGPDMRCTYCGTPFPWQVECTNGERLHQEIIKRRAQLEEQAARYRREVLERAWLKGEQRRCARAGGARSDRA